MRSKKKVKTVLNLTARTLNLVLLLRTSIACLTQTSRHRHQ
jgi:hypothetical protein